MRFIILLSLAFIALPISPVLANQQPVQSCCVLMRDNVVSSCFQFRDEIQDNDTADRITKVREFQQYKCQNVPYLYPDQAGTTARYVVNDAENSGVCGTAETIGCVGKIGSNTKATCNAADGAASSDCGSSGVYVCEDKLCKLKADSGCVRGTVADGQPDPQVNCVNTAKCKTQTSGAKCLSTSGVTPTNRGVTVGSNNAEFVPVIPVLGVQIPGFQFSPAVDNNGEIQVPYLSQYINAMYRYMTAVIVVIAIVMVTFGGFKYLLAATPMQVSDGKKIILDALIGMILVLGAYVTLNTINPELIALKTLKFQRVDPLAVDLSILPELEGLDPYPGGSGGSGATASNGVLPSESIAMSRPSRPGAANPQSPCSQYTNQIAAQNISCSFGRPLRSPTGGTYNCNYHTSNGTKPISEVKPLDLSASYGKVYYAPVAGKVYYTMPSAQDCISRAEGKTEAQRRELCRGGNYLRLSFTGDDGNPYSLMIMHIQRASNQPANGTEVAAGTPIGIVGGKCCASEVNSPIGRALPWVVHNCTQSAPCQPANESGASTGPHAHIRICRGHAACTDATDIPSLACIGL